MTDIHKPGRLTRKLMNGLRKLNIFPRLFLVFCALLITSTAFITFFNQTSYARDLEGNTVKYLSVLVQNANFKLQQEKETFEQGMTLFTRNESILSALRQNEVLSELAKEGDEQAQALYDTNRLLIEKSLLSVKNRVKGVKALVFVNEHTQYNMAASKNEGVEAIVRDLDAFCASEIYTQAVQAKGYPVWRDSVKDTTKLLYENERDQYGILGCITLSYQVLTPGTHQPLGVLVCCIYPQHFTQTLQEYSTQQGSNTFLVGENGMLEGILADFSAPPFPEDASLLHDQLFSQNQGSLTVRNNKKDLLVSFCGNEDFPIRIVNLTYRDDALQPVNTLRVHNLLILLIVILVGACGFYLTAVSIAYPVTRLIRSMKKVGAGDFDAMYKTESHDEIGVLCSEFDRMVNDMKELIDRVYVSETREKALELDEKNAQLDALQMQVNPHFLYNTLDMIRWQCLYENGGESPASDMIEKFCTLLRMTIKGEKKKETISESLLHAATYLEVVNFRNTSKIQLETQLDFEPSGYLIPCLSLQPILENAVRHGFSGEETDNRKICIKGRLNGDGNLEICVEDNGHGMTQEQLDALHTSMESSELTKNSIGLRNVNQRCKLCYGENYGIRIKSDLGKGTTVILTIPAEKGEEPIV